MNEPLACVFCKGLDGIHTVGCRMVSTCEHEWLPEPLVVLMERCSVCNTRRPIESRERRAVRLLTEVESHLHPETPSQMRAGLYEDLVQLNREMSHRAEILEARREEAHKTLDHLADDQEDAK